MDKDIPAYVDQIRTVIPFDIASVKVHSGGDDFLVLEINSKWMFRFPRIGIFSEAFEKEMLFLAKFNTISPLKIPNYQLRGQGFAGYLKVPGVPMSLELFQNLSASVHKKLAQQIGSFLSVLHNFPLKDAIEIGIPHSWDGNHHKHGMVFMEKVAPRLSTSARAKSIRCMERLMAEEFDSKVIHGDLYFPDHVFYDENEGQLGVIDFADVTIYDPAHDFQCIIEIGGETFFESVMKYYQGAIDDNLLKRSKLRLEARPLFYTGYIFASGSKNQYASRITHIEEMFSNVE